MQIKKINKKAEQSLVQQIIGVVIGACVVFILGVLLWNILSPYFDKGDEGAKSYLGSLKQAVSESENGVGEFLIWQEFEREARFYLIYFGGNNYYSYKLKGSDDVKNSFKESLIGEKNVVCICVFDSKELSCKNCFKLSDEAILVYKNTYYNPAWRFDIGDKVYIKKINRIYYFANSMQDISYAIGSGGSTTRLNQNIQTIDYLSQDNRYVFYIQFSYGSTNRNLFLRFDSEWKWCADGDVECLFDAYWEKADKLAAPSGLVLDNTRNQEKEVVELLKGKDFNSGQDVLKKYLFGFYSQSDFNNKKKTEEEKIKQYQLNIFLIYRDSDCNQDFKFDSEWKWYGNVLKQWTSVSKLQTDKIERQLTGGGIAYDFDKLMGSCVDIAKTLEGKDFFEGYFVLKLNKAQMKI